MAGGPVTNAMRADLENPYAWAGPLLLPLGVLPLTPGEPARLSCCMMGGKGPVPPSPSLTACQPSADCRHRREPSQDQQKNFPAALSLHCWFLLQARDVGVLFKRSFLLKEKPFLASPFSPESLAPSSLQCLTVSTSLDKLLSKLFTPRSRGGTHGWPLTGGCLASLSPPPTWVHPLSVDPWTAFGDGSFFSISLVFSRTT